MTRPHRNTRRDANQGDIVQGLQRLGFVVLDVSPICSYADILVCGNWRGTMELRWLLFEIKTPEGRLSAEQRAAIEQGYVFLARSAEDVLRRFGRVA